LTRATDGTYSVSWLKEKVIKGDMNEALRGMELSELVLFNGHLYTCDDRTGIVYELRDEEHVVPRWIMAGGDGTRTKGFKCEWMAVKDGELYVGSTGKEWTTPQGVLLNNDPTWIKVRRFFLFTQSYLWLTAPSFLCLGSCLPLFPCARVAGGGRERRGAQRGLGARVPPPARGHRHHVPRVRPPPSSHPAAAASLTRCAARRSYLIHEAVAWSPQQRRWYVLPRRVSREPYDDVADERRGSNVVLVADEDFTTVAQFTAGVRSSLSLGFRPSLCPVTGCLEMVRRG
jgi:soluble calcium-activated nucleotidase 1